MKARNRGWFVAVGTAIVVLSIFAAAGLGLVLTLDDSEAEAAPVRVLLVGDSIMKQAGDELESALEAREGVEVVDVRNEGRNGTGLLTPHVYDWQTEAPTLIEEYQPDVVVVLFVGNYTSENLWVSEGGVEVEGYTDVWFDEWEKQARELQSSLISSGADIYWVNPPPMIEEEGLRRVTQFRLIHRRIAEDWTDTVLIDGTDVLSDDEGNYASELPNEDGVVEQVRSLDSVHLTEAGSRLLAEEIARQITPSVLIAQRAKADED
jgi:hypothetical protein